MVRETSWGNLERKDFAIPIGTIVQPTSNKGTPGKIAFNNGAEHDSLRVRLVVPLKTRVLYGKKFTDPSRCGSTNYYTPDPRYKNPISHDCRSCFASRWEAEDDPQKIALAEELGQMNRISKPLCRDVYNLLLSDEDYNLFFLNLSGASFSQVSRNLLSRLRFGFSKYPHYLVEFTLTPEVRSAPNKHYVAGFSDFQVISEESWEVMRDLYGTQAKLAADFLSKTFQEMDEGK